MSVELLRQAWQDMLDALSQAPNVIEGPIGAVEERERAEGYRHLTRILSLAIEQYVEKGDPSHPEITRWMSPHRKVMGDNPGTIYDAVVISPDHHYVLRGNRGGALYLGVCLYGTGEAGSRRVAANIDEGLVFDDQGDFTLHLVPATAQARPLQVGAGESQVTIDADVTDLLVRQYFHDPKTQAEATYTIELVGAGPPPPPSAERLAAALRQVGAHVRDLAEVEATIGAIGAITAPDGVRKGAASPTGEVDWNVVNRVQPTPAVGYTGAWFADLDDDEAIVAEGTLPECRYASAQVLNRWMESGDYVHHQVFLTDEEMGLDEDRRFRIVLAHCEPTGGADHGAWIDTTGLRNGTFVVRTLGAPDAAPAQVDYRRIRLSS